MNKPIIITDIEQGTEEWHDLRKGIPTASNFGNIITPTGKKSTQDKKYLFKLVAESILGHQDSYKNEAMEHGNDTEALARLEYEMDTGAIVDQVGFVFFDKLKDVGCSPDGMIENAAEQGGVEIKCPLPHTHVSYLLGKKLPTVYVPQVQGSMWVTGRSWWDFFSYCEGLPNFRIRVERDEEYIKLMAEMVAMFVADLKLAKGAI